MEGISNLPALDPFQEIDPIESYESFKVCRIFLCGTADDIYWIESVKEGDQDQDGNAFEIFEDEKSEDAM